MTKIDIKYGKNYVFEIFEEYNTQRESLIDKLQKIIYRED